MTFDQFDKSYDSLIKETLKMRNTKGKEYAHDVDRLANFKRIANETGCASLKSVANYVRDLRNINFQDYNNPSEFLEDIAKRIDSLDGDPIIALYVYMKKHWDSISSYVQGNRTNLSEPIRGRLVDLITYAGLLNALVEEWDSSNTANCPFESSNYHTT